MRTPKPKLGTFAVALAFSVMSWTGSAQATIMLTLDDNTFSSADSEVGVTIQQEGDGVRIMLNVVSTNTGNIGDLRGLFFDLASFDAGSIYVASGADITGIATQTSDLGAGNSVSPLGPFDLAVAFGSPGIISDDIQSTNFLLSVLGGSILESDFSSLNLGVRVDSVGPAGGSRDGFSIVSPTVQVPEPGTLVLLGFGLLGLVAVSLRARTI